MKPFKAGVAVSKWLLRIALVLYLLVFYHDTLLFFDFLEVSFVFAVIYVLGAITLLVGGFRKDGNITVYSSFILLIAIGFNVYFDARDGFFGLIRHMMPLSIAFYFLSNGNK
jgi:hypothetical protein